MQHISTLRDIKLNNIWLTIGSFDGVHRGHQAIIQKLVAGAKGTHSKAVVLTFHPHPATVVRDRRGRYYLTTPQERAELLGELGVDVVITHPFDRVVAKLSARDFMSSLKEHLNPSLLLVGHDFALGRGREGNVEKLEQLGRELGYELIAIPPVELDGQAVSSSRVRSYLSSGEIDEAEQLLGRPYQIEGVVVAGDGRGRQLGIPTANLALWDERALPKNGVYTCQAIIDGITYGAVTNIGVRPTFDRNGSPIVVETHILELDKGLYGRPVKLNFIRFLRDEIRFADIDALIEQIKQDISTSKAILQELLKGKG